ncbi:MAG: shikimate kinase, partial [Lachnospiraceae bacterium]
MDNIILIGYMGCGKTTLGIRLSYHMRIPFLDTDKLIEKNENREISGIFAQDGEEAFREMETETLRTLLRDKTRKVISTGGGLPLREENRRLLKELGTVVYLRAEPETV